MSGTQYQWKYGEDENWCRTSRADRLSNFFRNGWSIKLIKRNRIWIFANRSRNRTVTVVFFDQDPEELLYQEMVAARFRATGEQPEIKKGQTNE